VGGAAWTLAHDLGLQAIAEGVEDRATQEVLATLGCDVAQGYYFSPPLLPTISFMDWAAREDDFALAKAQRAAADVRHRERCRKRTRRLGPKRSSLPASGRRKRCALAKPDIAPSSTTSRTSFFSRRASALVVSQPRLGGHDGFQFRRNPRATQP